MSNVEMLAELAVLKEAAREAKQEGRKAKIAAKVAKVRSAGNKQSVSKLMEIMFLLDDADEPWLKLGQKVEQDGVKVVTVDKVNLAIGAQMEKLAELRALVKTELGMYAVASVSELGWQLVASMERNPDLDKKLHGWDMEEVRANERKLMQYNREMAAATKGENTILNFVEIQFSRGRQVWRGPGGRRSPSRGEAVEEEHAAPPRKASKAGGGRGGGDKSHLTCYTCYGKIWQFSSRFLIPMCLEVGHVSYACPKKAKKKN